MGEGHCGEVAARDGETEVSDYAGCLAVLDAVVGNINEVSPMLAIRC